MINVRIWDDDRGLAVISLPEDYSKTYEDGVADGIAAYLNQVENPTCEGAR